jgi:elongation factor 1-alpha
VGGWCSGKSSLAGHLAYRCGGISREAFEKGEKGAADAGFPRAKYVWLMLRESAEKVYGSTINISHAQFETPSHIFTLIDTPGNRKYLKNMITGISQGDCAVLVVPT